MQAGVCRIRVLQNFFAENDFLVPVDNLGQPLPPRQIRITRARLGQMSDVAL
jgi:hypothetical protein